VVFLLLRRLRVLCRPLQWWRGNPDVTRHLCVTPRVDEGVRRVPQLVRNSMVVVRLLVQVAGLVLVMHGWGRAAGVLGGPPNTMPLGGATPLPAAAVKQEQPQQLQLLLAAGGGS
jgi:hypothetical protein